MPKYLVTVRTSEDRFGKWSELEVEARVPKLAAQKVRAWLRRRGYTTFKIKGVRRKGAYEFARRWQGPGRAQVYERGIKGNPARLPFPELYASVKRIVADKGPGARLKGTFYHDFGRGARVLGIPKGYIIADAQGNPVARLKTRTALIDGKKDLYFHQRLGGGKRR